jgi:hypothetical protein
MANKKEKRREELRRIKRRQEVEEELSAVNK